MEQDVLLLNGSRVVAMDKNKVLLTEMCPVIAGSGISVQNVLRTGKSVGHRHSVSDTDIQANATATAHAFCCLI